MKRKNTDLPIESKDAEELNSETEINNQQQVEQEVDFDKALLEEVLNSNNDVVATVEEFDDNSDNQEEIEIATIDRRKAYGKLSMEEKFKKARRTKWFKQIRNKIILIYFFPKDKKIRLKQQKQIFIRRFNEFFETNYRIDTISSEFESQYRKYVDSRGFIWAIRWWIVIVAVIVLPIALYFIITSTQ